MADKTDVPAGGRRLARLIDWAIFWGGGLSLLMAVGLTIAGALGG